MTKQDCNCYYCQSVKAGIDLVAVDLTSTNDVSNPPLNTNSTTTPGRY